MAVLNEPSPRALFQPWLQLPNAAWLKSALLLREQIDRIVPEHIEDTAPEFSLDNLASDPEVGPLVSGGLIDERVVTQEVAQEAKDRLLNRLDRALSTDLYTRWMRVAEHLPEPFVRLHAGKFGDSFINDLKQRNVRADLVWPFLYTDPPVVALYMLELAEQLRDDAAGTCLVSDNGGYAALDVVVDGQRDQAVQTLEQRLLATFRVDVDALARMPSSEFVKWHHQTKSTRASFRRKLGELGDVKSDTEFESKVRDAQDQLDTYIAAGGHSDSRRLFTLTVFLPLTGVAIDWSTGAGGLGTLVTTTILGLDTTVQFVKRWRRSRWERYVVEASRATPGAPPTPDSLNAVLLRLNDDGSIELPGN